MNKKLSRMKLLPLLMLVLFVACRETPVAQQNETADEITAVDTVALIADKKIDKNVQPYSSVEIDTSGILMFPLVRNESRDEGSFSSGGRESDYWNIIFYNSKTGGYHLLNDTAKMLIEAYSIDGDNSSSEASYSAPEEVASMKNFIFYKIRMKDYNSDKSITNKDPVYLFVTDKEGNRLRQISPENCNLVSYQQVKASNKVLMNVEEDTNHDKVFDENDERTWFEIRIGIDLAPKEIFNRDFKNKMKLLFHKQWMKP